MAGQVRADGQVIPKPASKVDANADLEVVAGPRFVSRGGEKLAAAFETFDLDVTGLVCADVGASTGGFTDCLLQHDAAKVYAIDVGQGILHWKLRNDPRVAVMEGTNARFVEALPEPVRFVSVDASFISLKILLPVVKDWFIPSTPTPLPLGEGEVLALIKPQFEAGRKVVARGRGVVRDPEVHRQVLIDILTFVVGEQYQIKGLVRSPVLGPKGNIEFLLHLELPMQEILDSKNIEEMVYSIVSIDDDAKAE